MSAAADRFAVAEVTGCCASFLHLARAKILDSAVDLNLSFLVKALAAKLNDFATAISVCVLERWP